MTGSPVVLHRHRQARARGVAAAALALALAGSLGGCVTPAASDSPPTATPSSSAPTTVAVPPPSAVSADAGLSTPQADPLYPDYGNPDLDVLTYQLVLGWAPTTHVLTGTAMLVIRPTKDVTDLSLDFVDSYTVDSATVDGRAETPGRQGNDIVVPAGKTLAKDSRTTLVVRYHGIPHQVTFPSDRGDAVEGLGLRPTKTDEAWTMQEPYGADTWYPVNDHPSDEATYDIYVTVPTGWSAIANGTPKEVTPNADTVTYHYISADPVASYVTTLAIGKYTKISETSPAGVPINCWLRTGRDEAFKPAVEDMPQLMSWLTDRYGPYPFPTAGVVIVDSDSAMETQQMITFGGQHSGSVDTADTEEVLLHELSHQWFGDAVTPTNWLGLWLNEGWAMYSEWLWTVDQGSITDAQWVDLAFTDDQRSRATAGPPGHPVVGHFAENNVYLGPALMLREIRKLVGNTEFFAMARDWVQTQVDKPVDRAGFIAFVNHHTGKNLTNLINLWLDSPTTPKPTP